MKAEFTFDINNQGSLSRSEMLRGAYMVGIEIAESVRRL